MEPRHLNRLTFPELAALVGAPVAEYPSTELHRISALGDATPDSIVFAQDDSALERTLTSRAGAILAKHGDLETSDSRVLWVRDPRFAMALAGKAFAARNDAPLIHPNAMIDPAASVGERTRVGAGAVIEAGAVVGEDCSIAANVTICHGVHLGNRVVVQPGAVLGSLGFGYARNPQTGEHLLFPQQGSLVIEDDVEIGANTTIDRGALGETRIGRGTKIDNLVHIGHNCIIGKNVVIAAQVGLSGSCTIDDDVIIAGQVGLGDHVHIGPGVILGGQSGVYPGKTVTGPGQIFAGTPAEPRTEYLKSLARIRRLKVENWVQHDLRQAAHLGALSSLFEIQPGMGHRPAVSGAANSLWLTEWLTTAMDLQPGMRVLDLGCGRAASSIFLRREFGVQVWATDLWFSASENIERIRDAGVEDGVFPIHADARGCRSPQSSSMPSCRSIPSCTTGPTTCT